GHAVERDAVEPGLALARREQSAQDPRQGRLAGPVVADDEYGLAAVDAQVDARKCAARRRGAARVDVPAAAQERQRIARAPPAAGGVCRSPNGPRPARSRSRWTATRADGGMPQPTSSPARTPRTCSSGRWNTIAVPCGAPRPGDPGRRTTPAVGGPPASTRAR